MAHTIILDPGHGGSDPGGGTSNGLIEKVYTLQIAQLVQSGLTAYGVQVVMTRQTDQDVSLGTRVAIANQYYPDAMFVSIHLNANESPTASGGELYVYGPQSWIPAVSSDGTVNHRDPQSYAIAQLMEPELKKTLSRYGITWRGILAGDFQVIRNTNGPRVLFEAFYASNLSDANAAKNPAFMADLANGIVRAIAIGAGLTPQTKQASVGGAILLGGLAYLIAQKITTKGR